MTLRREPIPVKTAIQRVINHTTKYLSTETVPLGHAYGRILAAPIIAEHDVPPFNRAAFDGYALRARDTINASETNEVYFNVIGTIGAGHTATEPLQAYTAYRIMTGAALPKGADAVVMLEETEARNDGFIIRKRLKQDDNIMLKGEDAQKGESLIEAGTVIHPGTIALLATFGYSEVSVAKQPQVSVIATGTELLDVSAPLEHGKIRNSNGPMLQAQLARMGINASMLGVLVDDPDKATDVLKDALTTADVIIKTGGVSVGDFDYLPEIYRRIGAEVLFNKVMMRPGSVTTVAHVDGKLLFGLSGNPSACYTGFELFTRPALLRMMGCKACYLPHMKAVLCEDFPKANPFTRFIRAIWTLNGSRVEVVPAGFNKSNAVSSIARGNCFIVLPSGSSRYEKGMEVDILLLGQEQGVTTWSL